MRISDWSSDVCSSDLAGVRRVDHGALAIADGVAPFGQIFIVAEVRRAAEMELRLAHLGREDEARVASDGIILVVEVVNIVSENRSEEHTSELQSLLRISYAVFCLKKKKPYNKT